MRFKNITALIGIFVFASVQADSFDDLNLQPGHWYEVPNSRMQDKAASPSYYNSYQGNTGISSVMKAWSGGTYDALGDRLVVWGGGHEDYGGNEVYAFKVKTLTWELLTDPSPGPYNQKVLNDGSPASVHTYDGIAYLGQVLNSMYAKGGGYYPSGSDSNIPWLFDFSNNQWTQLPTYPDLVTWNLTAYDAEKGILYEQSMYSLWSLNIYDPVKKQLNTNMQWTNVDGGNDFSPWDGTAAIDPVRNKMVRIGYGSMQLWDLAASNIQRQGLSTFGATDIVDASAPGFVYDPIFNRFVAWSGGDKVYSLDMDSLEWQVHFPAGSNTVVPTSVSAAGGTFGRFQYIPSKNAYIAVNATNENVYIYKLDTASGVSVPQAPSKPQVQVN